MVDDTESNDRPAVVLGVEMARAVEAERDHRALNPGGESPLAGLSYDRWAGELDLVRFRPSDTDDEIRRRLDGWQRSDLAELRARLTMDDFYTLLAFAKRAAVRSLRGGDLTWAVAGAQALPLISASRVDWRDLAVAAAVVAWQLRRFGEDAGSALLAAAEAADEEAGPILRRFAEDPPADLSDEWGFEVVRTPAGLGLAQRDYFAPYKPSADLVRVAVSLAEALDEDRYLADRFTVAADLPEVWLRGPEHEAASAAIERMQGCVCVSGNPRPETGSAPMTQMLTVWIIELANGADARIVTEAAARALGDHARIAQRQGPVACVVVARSVQVGVPALEDQATIERLRPAVLAALERAVP